MVTACAFGHVPSAMSVCKCACTKACTNQTAGTGKSTLESHHACQYNRPHAVLFTAMRSHSGPVQLLHKMLTIVDLQTCQVGRTGHSAWDTRGCACIMEDGATCRDQACSGSSMAALAKACMTETLTFRKPRSTSTSCTQPWNLRSHVARTTVRQHLCDNQVESTSATSWMM